VRIYRCTSGMNVKKVTFRRSGPCWRALGSPTISPDERGEIRDITPQSRSSYAKRQAQTSGVTSRGHLSATTKGGQDPDVAALIRATLVRDRIPKPPPWWRLISTRSSADDWS